ncbi:hypothetical protein GBF38_011511%2C partial [Xyrichtys novacula]|uniref:Uncharacterized protein n=1 Tax=Xyrichtys novacula TaxID=13765 RepID=A0AAV1H6S0_XYRNO|nr:hypothetical protein GBF38_011511%2C partial [Xyrichtys novacula]
MNHMGAVLQPLLSETHQPFYYTSLWDQHLGANMEVKEEILEILQKVWTKLQELPQASPLELGAFFVLILFVATVLFLVVLSCESLSREWISEQDMAVESVPELTKLIEAPEDWTEWFLYRLHQEPWAVGGAVVIGLFMLGILSLVVFALLYGCCCSQAPENHKLKRRKKSENRVI